MKAIRGSINLSKIDKARIIKGEKGKYLDFVLVPTPEGKYHNYMVVQNTAKDEETIIIGNAGKKFDERESIAEEQDGLPF